MIKRLLSLIHIHRWGRWGPCEIVELVNGRQVINTGQTRACAECGFTKARKIGW